MPISRGCDHDVSVLMYIGISQASKYVPDRIVPVISGRQGPDEDLDFILNFECIQSSLEEYVAIGHCKVS